MNQSHDTKSMKKTYEKPKLRVIELAAGEVLAIGCKTTSSGSAPGFPPPCSVHQCARVGS
jgi:hypothetical protein